MMSALWELTEKRIAEERELRKGGGESGIARQKRHGRLTVRERLDLLLDYGEDFFEIGLWAGWGMYEEWGGLPAAGVVAGMGQVAGRWCMIIGNDATVKAGAMFPQSVKKMLRAQNIAYNCRLPIIYLVDSSGVFLPLQEEIFPDEDDFGRIFRNNSVLSAQGIPQYAAIMGNCIAGGGYLPVLCDQLLMTQGSGLYLAGPALVKAAIGHDVDPEELGGVKMHAEVSGTVDYEEPDDETCLKRLRSLISHLPEDRPLALNKDAEVDDPRKVYEIVGAENEKAYDVHELLGCIIDRGSDDEYKKEYGKTLVTLFAKIEGISVGIVASQRKHCQTAEGEREIGGVIYSESADKAARFVMECNQMKVPLIFFQDVAGFMVGKEAERSGIIRKGAKLVNALSNTVVPKISIVVGNSFGAGNYALCGKAYDPDFILAWPNARYAVMGGGQASSTLLHIEQKKAEREGHPWNEEEAKERREEIAQTYADQMDIRYGAARGWVDAIIHPHSTRDVLVHLLRMSLRNPVRAPHFKTGVIQV